MAFPNPVTEQPPAAPAGRPLEASGRLPVMAGDAQSYFSGTAFGNQLTYIDLASYVWWTSPRLDAPVRVHLSERLDGIFTDAQLELTFLPNVDLPLGETYRIGDELDPDTDMYLFRIVDKTEAGGLITYVGETLVGDLARMYPRESFVLIPGQDGAPDPLTPGVALRLMLEHYSVPYAEPIPEFYFRTSTGAYTPDLDAFVIEPDPDSPRSLYEILREIFRPFTGYRFRANAGNQLTVAAPAWVAELGLQMQTYHYGLPKRSNAYLAWPYTEAPVVTVRTIAFPGLGSEEHTLTADTPVVITFSGITSTLEWDTTARRVTLQSTSASFLWNVTARVVQPESALTALTQADLAPDGESRLSLETVINQAEMTVQGLEFTSGAQIMQPAAFVLRGEAWRTGSFGYLIGAGTALQEEGEGEEESGIPDGFNVLAVEAENTATMFWPLADSVVVQPGSPITVTMEVEEWRDVWAHLSAGGGPSHADLELNHTASVEIDLPVDGDEHLLYTAQYEKYGIGAEGNSASGKVWGRFQGGDTPGVVLRVEQDPSMSGWTIIGGQAYFTYSLYVRLNGSGTVFQRVDAATSVRFAYTRDGDAFERGILIPGLIESQELYGLRELRIDSGIFQIPAATAFSMVRAIVEDNLDPKRVWTLGIVPADGDGYRVQPDHLGQALQLPWGELGRVTGWTYDEIHAPASDQTRLLIEVEVAEPLNQTRAGRTHYGAALYRISHYGIGEET